MPPLQQLQAHIVYRLVLAKTLFKKGIEACETNVDIYTFSHGLIALHDALDNFTGTIATYRGVSLQQESTLLKTINSIQDHERAIEGNFDFLYRTELVQLNTIRNNIKHQGIPPNISYAKPLIVSIELFFDKYSKHYFNLDWKFVSLAQLIEDESIREAVGNVEALIASENYKTALDEMAVIKFKVFDEMSLRMKLFPRNVFAVPSPEDLDKLKEKENIFLTQSDRGFFSDLYDRADFLEKGIDRNLMKYFESLTPTIGINNAKDWKYILKHGHNWAKWNWNKEIATHCLDFLIDAIVKHQGRRHAVKQMWVLEHYHV